MWRELFFFCFVFFVSWSAAEITVQTDLDVEESKAAKQIAKDLLTADTEPSVENLAFATYHKIIGVCHFLLDSV